MYKSPTKAQPNNCLWMLAIGSALWVPGEGAGRLK